MHLKGRSALRVRNLALIRHLEGRPIRCLSYEVNRFYRFSCLGIGNAFWRNNLSRLRSLRESSGFRALHDSSHESEG